MNKLELSIAFVKDNLHQVEDFIENMVETFELKESIRAKVVMTFFLN